MSSDVGFKASASVNALIAAAVSLLPIAAVPKEYFAAARPGSAAVAAMLHDNGSSADAFSAAGTLYVAKGNPPAARRAFEQALQLDPTHLEAVNGLVALDLAARKPDAAKARLESALSAHPKDSKLLYMAAQAHVLMRNDAKAEELLKRALAEDPDNLNAYSTLAVVFAQQHRLPEAQKEFEALAQRDPKSVWPKTMIAVLLQLQGDMPAAEKAYEHALQIDPTAPVAANNLAYMYTTRSGNLDIALQLAQTAKQKLPDEPAIADTLGWIYYKKNLPELAVPALLQSATQDPKNHLYHYHLGLAYAKLGEKSKARASLERAIHIQSTGADADDARRVLASLSS